MTFIPDSEIQNSEKLYRAIHPSFWNYDENRPTSALFKDNKGISVDRDGERTQDVAINFLLKNRKEYGSGNLNAGETREIGTFLKSDKIPDNDFHALILESEIKIQLSNSKAKTLSRKITIISPPSS